MSEREKSPLPLPLGELLEAGLSRSREERLWANIRARRGGLGGHSEPPKAGQYLPAPVGRVLVDGDELTNDRIRLWREIRARAARPEPERPWRMPAVAFFTAGLTALVLMGVLRWRGLDQAAVAARPSLPTALVQADGRALQPVEAGQAGRTVRLADASEIRLAPGARLSPLFSSGSRFELLLEKGSAEFSVTPGGPRRWVIEAGVARVEVVGTVFKVERQAKEVRVSVSHGIVLVRSEWLPGFVQRLTAGQSVEVRAPVVESKVQPVQPAAAARIELPELAVSPSDQSVIAQVRKPAPARKPVPWKAQLAEGRFAAAYEALGEQGLAREVARASSVDTLLALADVARLSGHPHEAIAPLSRVLHDFAESSQAALAAFTLGRMQLDQLGNAHAAAGAFEQAIAMHPPNALLADCHGRLVQAYARAGDHENAERAAARYRTLFPTGRHLADLERWTKKP